MTSPPAPAPSLPPTDPKQLAVQAELAQRVLARRRLIPFTQRINPRYMAGWVHQDICRRLERFSDDVAKGLSPRLMLLMPPRHGKSELASRMFPAWHLGRHPNHEIIACSYNVSLAMTFSRKVKETLNDPAYQTIFETRLNPDHQSAEEWGVQGHPGGYVAAGVGGGITGKGCHILIVDDPCVAAGERVRTSRGLIPVESVRVGDSVLTHLGRWRRVLAVHDNGIKDVVELRTSALKIRLTPTHKVYTSDGWVEARHAKDIYAEEVHAVWGGVQGQERQAEVLQRGLLGRIAAHLEEGVRSVRSAVSASARIGAEILHSSVRRGVAACGAAARLQALRGAVHDRDAVSEVLQRGVQASSLGGGAVRAEGCQGRNDRPCAPFAAAPGAGVAASTLQPLRADVQPRSHLPAVLRAPLQERGALGPDEGAREREFPTRPGCELVHEGVQTADHERGAGLLRRLLGMWRHRRPARAPSGRGQDEQQPGESGVPVPFVPSRVAQILERGRARVYDLTVEEDHSFVAEGLVVHNCKNAEEADSPEVREKNWDWYGSTAYTRLAPGGGVLLIETWWHDDDLAGRLQLAMAQDPEADQFEVVKYPAIAEHDEWLEHETDRIVHPDELDLIEGFVLNDPTKYTLLRHKGDALHPERYDIIKLKRIKKTIPPRFWSALYQQNPVPDDGAFFTKEQFKRGQIPAIRKARVYIAWDFAISEKKQNDYTVGTVGLQDEDDMLHVAEVLRFKSGDIFFIVESILNLSSRWYSPHLILGFEDGQIFRAIEALLRKRMRERQLYPAIEVLKPITDKLARARVLQGRMQQGMVSFNDKGDWYDTVRAEMLRFPAGVHDDCVDSAAWMATLAIGHAPPQKAKPKSLPSWRDKLKHIERNGGVSHMSA